MNTVQIKTIQFPCSHQPLHPYDIIKIECKLQIKEYRRLISDCVDESGRVSVVPVTEYHLFSTGPEREPFNPFCAECYRHNMYLVKCFGHAEEDAKKYLGEIQKYVYYSLNNLSEIVDTCFPLDLPYYIDRYCDDEEELRLWAERFSFVSFEEEVAKPIPATKESIEALRRSIIKNYETTNCAVCLEELYNNGNKKGALKVTMPCKHEFHEGCVVEWLRTSHICPLCRFELPIMEEVEPKQSVTSN